MHPDLCRAFITQFSRSMHVENLYNGIDFLVVMPLYVVSNLFNKDKGTFFWPMPIKLVEGTFAQLGKKMVYQGHGYWVHGFLSLLAQYNPLSLTNNLGRMDVRAPQSGFLACLFIAYVLISVCTFRSVQAHRANYRRKLERLEKEKLAKEKSQ
jgi:hypothetical protein